MSGPLQTGFQGIVKNQPAPAEAGDFTGVNVRAVVLAGAGQLVAPASGLTVGNFAWVDPNTGVVSQSEIVGGQLGFLHRENNAIIVNFLAPATYVVNPGLPITLFSQGDFWAKFPAGATPGQHVYADPGTGAPGTTATTASVTASVGATLTASVGTTADGHASAAAGLMTVTVAPTGGVFAVGDTITGTGVAGGVTIASFGTGTGGTGTYNLAPGSTAFAAATNVQSTGNALDATAVTGFISIGDTLTAAGFTTATVTAQRSGTPGGVGIYSFSGAQQNVASEAFVDSSNVLDVTAIGSGTLAPGDVLSIGPQIVSQSSGTPGGIGFYLVNGAPSQHASGTVTVGGVLTTWIVNSVAGAGELAKISTWG